MKSATAITLTLALIASAGCSRNSGIAVSGTVTRSGQPLEGATIEFLPEKGTSESGAKVKIAQGQYHVPASEGLKPGKYIVRVSLVAAPGRQETFENGSKGFRKQVQPFKFERELSGVTTVIDLQL